MSDNNQELSFLIREMLDGQLDSEQRDELLRQVESDDQARQLYLDQISTHTALRAVLADCIPDHDLDLSNQALHGASMHGNSSTTRRASPRWGILVTLASLAATALLCVALWNQPRDAGDSPTPAAVAKLSGMRDASFGLCDFAMSPGANLPEGTLRLQSGEVDLQFACGAEMTLQGPAVLHLKTPMLAVLESGRVSCNVPEQAIGFQVESAEYTVTDLGTRFELEVGQRQWVRVLEGEVDVEPKESSAVRLTEGETASVTRKRVTRHRVPLQEIPLGNLFDDPKGTPLRTAIRTDRKGATATSDSMGVQRVVRGEEVQGTIHEIAPGVKMNLDSLGWCDMSSRGVINDSWCPYTLRPIQTQESSKQGDVGEQGIGLQACQFVTFDIDEIRSAGQLLERELAFVADRVGVNWDQPDDSEVNLAVITSDGKRVTGAWVNGNQVDVVAKDSIATLGDELPRHAWRFSPVQFFCPLDDSTRYVTLISSAPSDARLQSAHGVFSGARLKTGSVDGWAARDGEFVQLGDALDQRFLFGDQRWSDYEFSFEAMKRFGKEGFLAIVRCADAKEFTWVNIGGWQNRRTQVERKLRPQGRQRPVGPLSDFVIEEGRWYRIRVRCKGYTVSLFVDDELLLQYEDDGRMQRQGKVGIGTWATSASFRNFRVESLDGEVLFEALAESDSN